jgi:hypothetical protein
MHTRSPYRTRHHAVHPAPEGAQDRRPVRQNPVSETPPHREHVRPPQGLAPHRNPVRPMRRHFPLRLRPRRRHSVLVVSPEPRAVGRFCAVPAAVENAETCAVHNSARIIARASLNVGRGFAYHLICSGRILRSAVRLLVHSATRENKPRSAGVVRRTARSDHWCQRRSKSRPAWRSKTRPLAA